MIPILILTITIIICSFVITGSNEFVEVSDHVVQDNRKAIVEFMKHKEIKLEPVDDLYVRLVTNDKELDDYNYLLTMSNNFIYRKDVKKYELSTNKRFFVGYIYDVHDVNEIAVCATSLIYTDWAYDIKVLEMSSSVTNEDYRNKGYSTKIRSAVLNYLMKNTTITEVYCNTDISNAPNIHLLKKMGFVCYGGIEENEKHTLKFVKKIVDS